MNKFLGGLLLAAVLNSGAPAVPSKHPPAKVLPPRLAAVPKNLVVAIGEPLSLKWLGGGKVLPQAVALDPETARVELKPGECRITGKRNCDITLILDWGKGKPRWSVPISFRPPAGHIDDPWHLSLTGAQDPDEALRHVLLGRGVAQARTSLTWEKDGRATIGFSAPGYLTVSKSVHVDTEQGNLAPPAAQQLMLSNRPEKLAGPGLLLQEPWSGTPARLLFHHKLVRDQDMLLEVRCRNLGAAGTFHLALSALGPAKDEIYVGHIATQRYLQKLTGPSLASWQVELPAGQEVCLERMRLKPGQTVSGVALLSGDGPLQAQVRVVACELDGSGADAAPPETGPAGRTARGSFPAEIAQSYAYQAGQRFLYIQLGGPPYLADPATGEKSPGNFGALYHYSLQLSNPTEDDYEVSLSASARGGPARGHFFLDGQLLKDPGNIGANPALLQRWHLAPGEQRQVQLDTFPQSGSNYPVELVVGAIKSKAPPPLPVPQGDP